MQQPETPTPAGMRPRRRFGAGGRLSKRAWDAQSRKAAEAFTCARNRWLAAEADAEVSDRLDALARAHAAVAGHGGRGRAAMWQRVTPERARCVRALLALAAADGRGRYRGLVRASQETLAALAHVSRRTAGKVCKDLEIAGVLDRRASGGIRDAGGEAETETNTYVLRHSVLRRMLGMRQHWTSAFEADAGRWTHRTDRPAHLQQLRTSNARLEAEGRIGPGRCFDMPQWSRKGYARQRMALTELQKRRIWCAHNDLVAMFTDEDTEENIRRFSENHFNAPKKMPQGGIMPGRTVHVRTSSENTEVPVPPCPPHGGKVDKRATGARLRPPSPAGRPAPAAATGRKATPDEALWSPQEPRGPFVLSGLTCATGINRLAGAVSTRLARLARGGRFTGPGSSETAGRIVDAAWRQEKARADLLGQEGPAAPGAPACWAHMGERGRIAATLLFCAASELKVDPRAWDDARSAARVRAKVAAAGMDEGAFLDRYLGRSVPSAIFESSTFYAQAADELAGLAARNPAARDWGRAARAMFPHS